MDSPHVSLETPRLHLTSLCPDDLSSFEVLHTDEQVRQYLGGVHDLDVIRARFWKNLETAYSNTIWVVRLRADNSFLGIVALQTHHDGVDTEVSYVFLPKSWGNGYASEAVQEILAYAMLKLGLSRIVAETQTANLPSCRLLERIGMIRERTVTRFGAEQAVYVIEKKLYNKKLVMNDSLT